MRKAKLNLTRVMLVYTTAKQFRETRERTNFWTRPTRA